MILCFDIGGSRIKAALDSGGELQILPEVATPAHDLDGLIAALKSCLVPDILGVSVSIAGAVDSDTNIANIANIPCLNGLNIAAILSAALGVKTTIINDADSFALAEAVHGAGRVFSRVFAIILGSGVGGGIVLNGAILHGAGEWGHGPIIQNPSLPCGCGQIGCLDTIGGARGLERLHLHMTGMTATSEDIISTWLRAGAHDTVACWVELVSSALAMAVNMLGAQVVPVGGGLGNVPQLIAALDTAVRKKILRSTTAPIVVCAQISVDAGLIGAAIAGRAALTQASLCDDSGQNIYR